MPRGKEGVPLHGFKRRVVHVSYVCTTFAGHPVMGLLAKLFETRVILHSQVILLDIIYGYLSKPKLFWILK